MKKKVPLFLTLIGYLTFSVISLQKSETKIALNTLEDISVMDAIGMQYFESEVSPRKILDNVNRDKTSPMTLLIPVGKSLNKTSLIYVLGSVHQQLKLRSDFDLVVCAKEMDQDLRFLARYVNLEIFKKYVLGH